MLLFEQRVHSWVLLQRSRQATHLQEGGSGQIGKRTVCVVRMLLVRLPWVEEVQLEAKLRTHAGTYTHQGKVPFPGRVWLKPTTCSAIAFNLLHPCAARPVPAFIIRAHAAVFRKRRMFRQQYCRVRCNAAQHTSVSRWPVGNLSTLLLFAPVHQRVPPKTKKDQPSVASCKIQTWFNTSYRVYSWPPSPQG